MKNLVSSILSVLILVLGIVASVYLPALLIADEWYRWFAFKLGSLALGLLIFFVVTGIAFFLVQRNKERPDPDKSMPVLRPIPIPTRGRSLLMRVVVWLHQVRTWEVVENWEYTLPKDETRIVIPKGFRFDGASIPRPLWAILNPIGLLLIPGLIHDYGYRYRQLCKVENGTFCPYKKGAGKATWDRLFREIGRDVNGMSFINFAAWLAVYFGGHFAWRTNRNDEEKPVVPEGSWNDKCQDNDSDG